MSNKHKILNDIYDIQEQNKKAIKGLLSLINASNLSTEDKLSILKSMINGMKVDINDIVDTINVMPFDEIKKLVDSKMYEIEKINALIQEHINELILLTKGKMWAQRPDGQPLCVIDVKDRDGHLHRDVQLYDKWVWKEVSILEPDDTKIKNEFIQIDFKLNHTTRPTKAFNETPQQYINRLSRWTKKNCASNNNK